MKTKEEIFSGLKLLGIPTLLVNFILHIGSIVLFIWSVAIISNVGGILYTMSWALSVIMFIWCSIAWVGFMKIEPNEARVMVFFGKYKGTIKENGYFWVNPLYAKNKMTLRARNLDVEPIKVNDKKGNPIMIGLMLVWRIANTYKAAFDVDNTSMQDASAVGAATDRAKMRAYENFVEIQSDAALRNVAGMYAYDNLDSEKSELTLRSGGEEINDILERQLNERLAIAGIEVMEARINYLAYAPEIAAVMLRRQQADAIISAREKIVDGAVGMVKMALNKLSEEDIITLDEDKKAAMVSNLLVVLCSDTPAQPIVNSGTLYN